MIMTLCPYPILCGYQEACFHLNAYRGINPWSPEKERRVVPDVVIHSWFKSSEPVTKEEVSLTDV